MGEGVTARFERTAEAWMEHFGDWFVPVTETGCWLWTRHVGKDGYAKVPFRASCRGAHRWAYELLRGPVPDGLQLDHLCRVRSCVNPAHLEPVTARENTLRGKTITARNATTTHCPQGHPYDARNTWVHKGYRHCRECRRLNARALYRAAHPGCRQYRERPSCHVG